MKKIFTTLVLAFCAMAGFAQSTQQYFRVEFTVPITGDKIKMGQTNNSVAATMKDDYTFCNPEHDYLDFQAANPMTFRTTASISATSAFYMHLPRVTQSGQTDPNYPYLVDRIQKITAYSIPVEKITCDSTTTHEIVVSDEKGDKTFKVAEFTFNRLPRNVAELKTLIEDGNGNLNGMTNNPLFVAATLVAVWPRVLDCSQDARDMIDYLCGKHYEQLNATGISNKDFQDVCISGLVSKDGAGQWQFRSLFGHFDGATPSNKYKPNGKSYTDGPFKVRVGWHRTSPLSPMSGWGGKMMAKICLFPNPGATTDTDRGFTDPDGRFVELRQTSKNGWFVYDKITVPTMGMKDQFDNDF